MIFPTKIAGSLPEAGMGWPNPIRVCRRGKATGSELARAKRAPPMWRFH